jgi:hypothetical protein
MRNALTGMSERWEVGQRHTDHPDLLGSEPQPDRMVGEQIGGSARAYLADSSRRQRSAIMGIHGMIASGSWEIYADGRGPGTRARSRESCHLL